MSGPAKPRTRVGRGGRPSPWRSLARLLAGGAGLALLLLAAPVTGVRGQEEVEEPPTAEAPRPFRIFGSGGGIFWDDDPRTPDDMALAGLSVERILFRFLSARLEGAYGSSEVPRPDGSGSEEIKTWLVDFLVTARVDGPLDPIDVVPFATVGVGSTSFDPEEEDLVTKNQNAFEYGAGIDYQPFSRFGIRAEYRRYSVDLEDLFDLVDRTGESSNADRFMVGLLWTF